MKLKTSKQRFDKISQKYFGIYLISFKETIFFPAKLRTVMFITPFRLFILLLIYNYAFSYIGRPINGINANIAIWSIAIYHILLFTQFRGIFQTINDDIRRGNLETHLIKPYDYLIFRFWEHLGKGLPNLSVSFISVIPLLFLLTGSPQTQFTLSTLFGAIYLLVGGTLVSAVLYIFIVLPALWIDDAQPFFWIVDKSILILGGGYIPLALLPQSFQTFASLTPFGAPMFATQMFYPDFSERWFLLFGVQVFWLIVLLIAISFVFTKAKYKLSINGG